MKIFLTSDTHFSHQNILTAGEGRPFSAIEEHNKALVENWNRVVRPEDAVIHLGDVAMGHRIESLKSLDELNGFKILVPGNHDYVSATESESKRAKYGPVYGQHFDAIWSDTVRCGRVVMSHFPPAEIPDHGDEDRFPQMRPALGDGVEIYLHGHTHQQHRLTRLSNGSEAFSVGVDANNWTPVNMLDIPAIRRSDFEVILEKVTKARG